jgi:hypothetical protein
MLSAEPSVNSKFKVAIIWAGQAMNGSKKDSRTELVESGNHRKWRIYDKGLREISSDDKVRITGFIIEPCVVKADRIEKL